MLQTFQKLFDGGPSELYDRLLDQVHMLESVLGLLTVLVTDQFKILAALTAFLT